MKKIAFFVQLMHSGGVENALIALTQNLIRQGQEVTVFVIVEKGDFMEKIPAGIYVRTIPMSERIRRSIPVGGTRITVREHLKKKDYITAAKFMLKHKFGKSEFAELNADLYKIPHLEEYYDIAVNFHMHSPFLVWYLSERVQADRKFTWIHNDFYTTGYHIEKLKPYLGCVDCIYGVSEKVVREFLNMIPEYRNKTKTALNIVPVSEIRKRSEEYYPQEYLQIPPDHQQKILTVGRLEEQKGYDIAIDVAKKLKDEKISFQWFVLGEGTLKDKLLKRVDQLGLQDSFRFLGMKQNPYPYFKNCDIYVQTSKHEGYVTTVTEAKIFSKPIVITDFAGAREQIRDGLSGDIANIEADDVFKKLKRLICEEKRRESYSAELQKEHISEQPDWIADFM